MLKSSRALRILLFLLIPVSVFAAYSPGQLIVRLKSVPNRTLDGSISATGASSLDAMLSAHQAQVSPTLGEFSTRFPEVQSIVSVGFSSDLNLDSLENAVSADPQVEWVTRNYRYHIDSDNGYTPNDSLFTEQWWLQRISAPLAWEITHGDTSIIIGIIDTGVDYLHPDLAPNIWHNWADNDSNGIDDDNNGFIDDRIGWDFTDAPTLPAPGDYLGRDNDPMDEPGGLASGHGTYVSGIASAATDNQQCFASIGFNCRLMCLRAGNSNGYLEEDDIAAALLYGAENGASVINMSFGDVVASPLLREAVLLAYQSGVVLVASAGNQRSDQIHYPSGYAEVIGVGATDALDRRAYGFSNYGPSVDVMAPGDNIFSTILGGDCGEWTYPSGTSYSAPMVCGVAGLVLSVNRQLSPADVAQIIISTADDIGTPGWDPETAHGRINARRAVEQAAYGSDVVARISSPQVDQGMSTDFAVYGEAWGATFDHYELSYGLGEDPAEWIPVAVSSERQYGDSLGWITLPSRDTVMTVRLETHGTGGAYAFDHVHIYVQRSAPHIDSLWTMRMLDYDTYGDLVQVKSNQVTTASFILTNALGDSLREDFGYVADQHAGVLSQISHPGVWTVRVRLENQAGMVTYSDPFTFQINEPSFTTNIWERTETNLSNGYLSPFVTDINCDGHPEIWLQPTQGDVTTGPLEPYEWNGSQFDQLDNSGRYGVNIPQAAGDANGNGLTEIMMRFGGSTFVWEQSSPCQLPDHLVLADTTNFLGAGFVDMDSADGRQEIIGRVYTLPNQFRPRYVIFDVADNYSLTPLDTIPNETAGSNDIGPPQIRIGDVDQDGLLDFVYGDYDGDVILCERASNGHISQVWSTRLPINDATSWFGYGDLDGDGSLELVAGCRSNQSGGTESERRAQHWEYYIFHRTGDNAFSVVDSVFILGNENVTDHPASVTIADVDADGRADILISAYPDFYIVSYDVPSGRYKPRWYYSPSQTNTCVVVDWDGDGVNEFFMADGTSTLRIEAASASGQRPTPPLHLTGEPLSSESIVLRWNAVAGADSYLVYQAATMPNFSRLIGTTDTFATINSVPENVDYTYAATTVDPAFPTRESVYSNYVHVIANAPPSVQDTAQFVEPHFVRVRFSEAMGPSALQQWNYHLDGTVMPDIVTSDEGGRVIVLAFLHGLGGGWHSLRLRNLFDAQNSALPDADSTVVFDVTHEQISSPHLLSHRIIGGASASQVEITFSEPMSASVLNPANYHMQAPRRVVGVDSLQPEFRQVLLHLDPRYPVGALDLPARIMLRSLTSASNIPMDTTAGRADIVVGGASASISELFVYPNPYRGSGPNGDPVIVFAGLPEQATIRIFTIQGVLVHTIHHQNSSGADRWNLLNDKGNAIASGIYLYSAESNGQTVRGKFAVLR